MATLTDKTASLSHESQDIRTVLLTQKAELMSELAQAMANQFNNIMMAITSYAELELKKAARIFPPNPLKTPQKGIKREGKGNQREGKGRRKFPSSVARV